MCYTLVTGGITDRSCLYTVVCYESFNFHNISRVLQLNSCYCEESQSGDMTWPVSYYKKQFCSGDINLATF